MNNESWLAPWFLGYASERLRRVAIDAGANEGQWSVVLAQYFNKVIAIEPNPQCFPALERACAGSNIITVCKRAVWSSSKPLILSAYESNQCMTCGRRFSHAYSGAKMADLSVQAISLDDHYKDLDIDFIKMDIEGAEVEALIGARRIIEARHPAMIIEVHTADHWLAITRMLTGWEYIWDAIRHPHYRIFSSHYYHHCWIAARPACDVKTSIPDSSIPSA